MDMTAVLTMADAIPRTTLDMFGGIGHIGSVVSGHKPWLPWTNFKIIMSNNQAVLSKNNPKISYRYNPQISQKIYTTVLCVVCDITLSWLSSPVNIRFY